MIKKIIFLIILNSAALPLFSQTTGEITGRVLDESNQQYLPDVSVSAIKSGKVISGSLTNEGGFFKISNLPVGEYSVRFELAGYLPLITDNVIVNSGAPSDLKAELKLIITEEIEVTGDRFKFSDDVSNSAKNLQYEEIRRTPGGFEDIGRVVQILPGVSFVNDGRNDLIVRGGSSSENLYIVDNTSIPNINHFGSQGSTGGPISIIDLDFIREVDFLTGGFSAKYGDKLSSVLEINLREGNRDKFLTDINLSGTGFGAVLEGPLGSGKRGSWLFSARRSYLDFIFNASGFGFVPSYSSAQLKAVYDLNSKNILTVNAIANYDYVNFNNDTEENIQNNQTLLDNDQWGYVNSYELKSLVSKNSFATFNLGRTFTSFNYTGKDSAFKEVFKNKSKEGETTLKTDYFINPGLFTQIQTGAGWRFINFRNDIVQDTDTTYYIDPETNQRYVLPAVNISDDNNTGKAYLYTQLTQYILKKVKLNLGLRYDYFGFINDKNYISPRASLTYSVNSMFSLSFAYGIFYQSPSYVWLIANKENRNLKNIKAGHYIAGIEFLPGADIRMTLEAYYKDYSAYPVSTLRPYLILANTGGNFEEQDGFGIEPLQSKGTGFARGIEFFMQKVLTDNFYGTLNLSFFEAKYKALDGIERRSDFDNRFLATISGGYKFGDNWEAGAKFRFSGGRPYTPINPENGTRLTSGYNTAQLPDYSRLDVRLDKRWNFKSWTLVTYIDIQNLFNKKNVTEYDWNKYKKEIEANESIGILPTIGVNIMF